MSSSILISCAFPLLFGLGYLCYGERHAYRWLSGVVLTLSQSLLWLVGAYTPAANTLAKAMYSSVNKLMWLSFGVGLIAAVLVEFVITQLNLRKIGR